MFVSNRKFSIKEHVDQCEFERFQCKLCSVSLNSRFLYDEHLKICPKAKVFCPLKKLGCRDEVRRNFFRSFNFLGNFQIQIERELLREHVVSSFVEHFQLISDAFSSSPARIEIEKANEENETLEQIRTEQKTLRALLLKREQELTKSRVDLQLYKGEICQLKKELELTKSLMSDDGTFLWKIENVQQLILNAKNSAQPTCLTSPVFYTSRYGYKLSMKIYLNGDKTCRNTHLSLYVTVMRGQYDSLLQWPFSYPITFCLYDRSPHQDHVVHTLTPDLTSESFQQPTMDANKSGGIPQFCPLCKVFSKEFGYVNENTMFVKAFVDFRIYPTKIWPNWTKLQSSGLPNHVESMKLRNFIENPK